MTALPSPVSFRISRPCASAKAGLPMARMTMPRTAGSLSRFSTEARYFHASSDPSSPTRVRAADRCGVTAFNSFSASATRSANGFPGSCGTRGDTGGFWSIHFRAGGAPASFTGRNSTTAPSGPVTE
jgi:hypothetical protein